MYMYILYATSFLQSQYMLVWLYLSLFIGDIRYDVYCGGQSHLCSQGYPENEMCLLLLYATEWEMEGKQNGVSITRSSFTLCVYTYITLYYMYPIT